MCISLLLRLHEDLYCLFIVLRLTVEALLLSFWGPFLPSATKMLLTARDRDGVHEDGAVKASDMLYVHRKFDPRDR